MEKLTSWQRQRTSRRTLVTGASIASAALATAALVGCGDDDDSGSNATAPAGGTSSTGASGTPKSGGTLKLHAFGGPTVTDPHKTISVIGTNDVWSLVGNTVLRLDWKNGNTPTPGLAESWEFADPTTLTLKLKKGVHFQKTSAAAGRELTAADVVANLERVRTTGDPSFTMAPRFRFVDTYTAVDANTVQVKFKQPDANFLSWMTHPGAATILPKEALEKYGANLAVVDAWSGTGPFVVDAGSYKPGISLRLTKNPAYDASGAGLPYLDAIELVFVADASARAAALRTGALDVGLAPNLEVDSYKKKNYQMGSTEDRIVAAQHLAFNVAQKPMDDPRIRQAIHRAIDRPELLQIVGDGFADIPIIHGLLSSWFQPPSKWEGKPGFRKKKDEDIAEAKSLFSAAGIDPKSLTLRLGAAAQNPYKVHYEQAVAIKGILERNLGMKVDLKADAGADYQSQKYLADNGIHLTNVSDGGVANLIIDDATQGKLLSTARQNSANWNDPKTDELINKQAATLDVNERKKILAELQDYLMDDNRLPVAPTARNYDWYAAVPDIRDWTAPSYFLSNYAWQMDRVWLNS